MKNILGLHLNRVLLVLIPSFLLAACSVTENTNVVDNHKPYPPAEVNHQHTHPEINKPAKEPKIIEVAKVIPRPPPKVQIRSVKPRPPIRPRVTPRSTTPRIHKTVVKRHHPRKKPRRTVLTHAQRFAGVLESHNVTRRKHGLQSLKWSEKLARYSKQWTDHLGSGSHCQIRHRGGTPPYGENLYRASALRWSTGERETLPVTIKNVVKAWTDEEKWYDYNRNRCQPGKQCGHYTQIVWRKTTEVGCALKVCADKSQIWVCSYNPPGNFQGVRPY